MFGSRTPDSRGPKVSIQLPGTRSKPYTCKLYGLSRGALHVLCGRQVARSMELAVSFGDMTLSGRVEYCRPRGQNYLICILLTSPMEHGARRDPRLPINQTCSVTPLDDKRQEVIQATITDISAAGMGLQTSQPIQVGTMICVQTDELLAAGEVLHCRRVDENKYASGMTVTDTLWGEKTSVTPWSARGKNWLKRILGVRDRAADGA